MDDAYGVRQWEAMRDIERREENVGWMKHESKVCVLIWVCVISIEFFFQAGHIIISLEPWDSRSEQHVQRLVSLELPGSDGDRRKKMYSPVHVWDI